MAFKSNYVFQLKGTLLTSGSSVAISTDLELGAVVSITDARMVIRNRNATQIERVVWSAAWGTLTLSKRGLTQADTEVEDAALKKEWGEWDIVYVTILAPQLADRLESNVWYDYNEFEGGLSGWEFATTAARDTALWGDWVATNPYTGVYVVAEWLFYNYNLSTAQRESVDTGTATPNASPTVSWSVEIPTTAQVTAGDDTGETWAYLAVTPELLAAQIQSWSYLYWVDAWWDDAYVVALMPTLTAYTVGQLLWFKVTTANTWACTVNFWPWVLNIKTKDGNNPQSGVIRTSWTNYWYYDWTNFVLLQEDFATDTSRGIAEKLTNSEALAFTDTERFSNAYQLLISNRYNALMSPMFNFFTDFITAPTSTWTSNDVYATTASTGAVTLTTWSSNKFGVVSIDAWTSNWTAVVASWSTTMVFSWGVTTYETLINISSLSVSANRYQILCGFFDTYSGVNQVDWTYFLYDLFGVSTWSAASANWQIVTAQNVGSWWAATFTTTSTAVAAWSRVKLKIVVNAGGTSVEFFVNNVSVGTIATNIPSTSGNHEFWFGAMIAKSTSSWSWGRLFLCDYIAVDCLFTTPR